MTPGRSASNRFAGFSILNGPSIPKIAAIVMVAIFALGMTTKAARADHKKGTPIAIKGRVVDSLGAPLANMTVILEATRKTFSITRMEKQTVGILRRPTASAAHGEFSFEWRWDDQYKKLEVVAGVPGVNGALEELVRQDVTPSARAQLEVTIALVIEAADDLDLLRRIIGGQATVDEKRVFSELGRPDRLERRDDTRSWWYFEQGRVYRFRSGKLEQVVPFPPVTDEG